MNEARISPVLLLWVTENTNYMKLVKILLESCGACKPPPFGSKSGTLDAYSVHLRAANSLALTRIFLPQT